MAQSAATMQKTIEREATDEEIRQRAYEIYLARGAAPGFELDDWLQAERELRKKE
jgi:hypothetical protein